MRNPDYRGKRHDNSEWIYGSYVVCAGVPDEVSLLTIRTGIVESTSPGQLVPVDPETVGQFIDHYDVNRKKIYEKMAVKIIIIEDERKGHTTECNAIVRWDSSDAGFYYETDYDKFPHVKPWFVKRVEIISE